uniref:Uncharacterized protein n=1 Tax=Chlorobium phaeobacteroides (strain BS1) TaxID=331678 RepID=B3EJ94_CHLPB
MLAGDFFLFDESPFVLRLLSDWDKKNEPGYIAMQCCCKISVIYYYAV